MPLFKHHKVSTLKKGKGKSSNEQTESSNGPLAREFEQEPLRLPGEYDSMRGSSNVQRQSTIAIDHNGIQRQSSIMSDNNNGRNSYYQQDPPMSRHVPTQRVGPGRVLSHHPSSQATVVAPNGQRYISMHEDGRYPSALDGTYKDNPIEDPTQTQNAMPDVEEPAQPPGIEPNNVAGKGSRSVYNPYYTEIFNDAEGTQRQPPMINMNIGGVSTPRPPPPPPLPPSTQQPTIDEQYAAEIQGREAQPQQTQTTANNRFSNASMQSSVPPPLPDRPLSVAQSYNAPTRAPTVASMASTAHSGFSSNRNSLTVPGVSYSPSSGSTASRGPSAVAGTRAAPSPIATASNLNRQSTAGSPYPFHNNQPIYEPYMHDPSISIRDRTQSMLNPGNHAGGVWVSPPLSTRRSSTFVANLPSGAMRHQGPQGGTGQLPQEYDRSSMSRAASYPNLVHVQQPNAARRGAPNYNSNANHQNLSTGLHPSAQIILGRAEHALGFFLSSERLKRRGQEKEQEVLDLPGRKASFLGRRFEGLAATARDMAAAKSARGGPAGGGGIYGRQQEARGQPGVQAH